MKLKRIAACMLGLILCLARTACGEPEITYNEPEEVEDRYTEVVERKDAPVGSFITFGAYEQDADEANGKEDIEWLVLDRQDDRILVISRYALDNKPYNDKATNITWETCTLRKWLNNDFLQTAFSSTEQAMIPTVTVSADKNPDNSTNPGSDTQDRVFLLSVPEVNRYFTTQNDRQCKPTAYAEKQGAIPKSDGFDWWWLRTPGNGQTRAAVVMARGGIGHRTVNSIMVTVRPALWLTLEP